MAAGSGGDGGEAPRLGAMEVGAAPSSKVSAPPAFMARARGLAGSVSATVRVGVAGYVPPGVTLRARIDPLLFTADVPVARLPDLEADAAVVSVQPALPLPTFPTKEGD
jgi:hypothetical protein